MGVVYVLFMYTVEEKIAMTKARGDQAMSAAVAAWKREARVR